MSLVSGWLIRSWMPCSFEVVFVQSFEGIRSVHQSSRTNEKLSLGSITG